MTKILVVDDEPAILDMILAILREEGYTALAAESGPRALDLLPREQPDVLLLDLMMPGMDGREVCRRMRALPDLDNTRIVLISAA